MKILGSSLLIVVLAAVVVTFCPSVREPVAKAFRSFKGQGGVAQTSTPWTFYGQVIDQDGTPVEGAEVTAELCRYGPNAIYPGENRYKPGAKVVVRTDQAGKFSVQIARPLEELEIKSIEKPGYDWVTDWWWSGGGNKRSGDNTVFNFARGTYSHGRYEPDAALPAIFPMQPKGSAAPATRPSRGGRDLYEMKRIENQPTDWVVPSHGAGAPRSNDEIGQFIRRHSERLNSESIAREQQRVDAAAARKRNAATQKSK